jgi:hypothetical protein
MRLATALTALTALAGGAALAAGPSSGASPCSTVVRGTSASETMAATAARTRLLGLEGDDRISGSAGNDCIDGGPGNDRIAGLGGADRLDGAAGDDMLTGAAGADRLAGGMGKDKLSGGAGADRLSDVPQGYDEVSLQPAVNRLAAGAGADRVDTANGRRDQVHCGNGRDRAVADRVDRLESCERKTFPRSPLPQTAPRRGTRGTIFIVRFRALEEVASLDEQFAITVEGPPACGRLVSSSLGVRYRVRETVRYRLRPFGPGGHAAKRWCRGLYRGTVDFVRAGGMGLRLGHFSFRVR